MKKEKRPFVFLCTGMSLDGKLSNYKKECSPISSDDNRDMLYDARIEADAVMIGGNTLLLDDSSLTVKTEERRSLRVANGKLPEPMKVAVISDASSLNMGGDFFNKGEGSKVIFTTTKTPLEKINEIEKKAKVYVIGNERVDLEKAMKILKSEGVEKLLVEGGGELIASLLEMDLVDEIRLKIGDLIIGGRTSVTLADGRGFDRVDSKKVEFTNVEKQGNCIIVKAKVIKNE